METIAEIVGAARDEFGPEPAGCAVMPCQNAVEGDIGHFLDLAIGKAKRWVLGDYVQQNSNSCVIASSRNMIYRLTGKNISEDDLQNEMRVIMGNPLHDFEVEGINPLYAEDLLKKHGIDIESHYAVGSDKLPDLVRNNQPALIGFKNPGHRVLLESVSKDVHGNRTYNVVDPDPAYNGRIRNMSQQDFDSKYNSDAIVIVGKFTK